MRLIANNDMPVRTTHTHTHKKKGRGGGGKGKGEVKITDTRTMKASITYLLKNRL